MLRRRPVPRRVLSNWKSSKVGYWRLESVCEVAHYYHERTEGQDKIFEHSFCYRNNYPETFTFNRSVSISGPGIYQPRPDCEQLVVKARPEFRNPEEALEQPPCAELRVAGEGEIYTEAVLTPEKSYKARLPDEIKLTSRSTTSDLDGCGSH